MAGYSNVLHCRACSGERLAEASLNNLSVRVEDIDVNPNGLHLPRALDSTGHIYGAGFVA